MEVNGSGVMHTAAENLAKPSKLFSFSSLETLAEFL